MPVATDATLTIEPPPFFAISLAPLADMKK